MGTGYGSAERYAADVLSVAFEATRAVASIYFCLFSRVVEKKAKSKRRFNTTTKATIYHLFRISTRGIAALSIFFDYLDI